MGLMSWLQGKGALGGIARSTAKYYRKAVADEPGQHLTSYLGNIAILRYLAVGQPNNAKRALEELYRAGQHGTSMGLANLCLIFAEIEMDIEGIEGDTYKVLEKVLREEGLSWAEIQGEIDPNQFSEHFLELLSFGQ